MAIVTKVMKLLGEIRHVLTPEDVDIFTLIEKATSTYDDDGNIMLEAFGERYYESRDRYAYWEVKFIRHFCICREPFLKLLHRRVGKRIAYADLNEMVCAAMMIVCPEELATEAMNQMKAKIDCWRIYANEE